MNLEIKKIVKMFTYYKMLYKLEKKFLKYKPIYKGDKKTWKTIIKSRF